MSIREFLKAVVVRMLVLSAVFFVLSSLLSYASTTDPTSISHIIEKVKRGVVKVQPQSASAAFINVSLGGGSGFIVSKEGHFITNVHVLGGASLAAITLWDGTTYRGELLAVDPGIDIAIGKLVDVPPEKIHPVPFGDSDILQPGEYAMAMGNPGDGAAINIDPSEPVGAFLLAQSATVRVVAGLDNTLTFPLALYGGLGQAGAGMYGDQYGTNLTYALRIQTPIAGGNSGGPLFNMNGEVIGINSWGGTDTIMQSGNYSVPINLAKEFYYSVLRSEGDVPFIRHQARPWLGLDICMPSNIWRVDRYIEFIERYRPKDRIIVFGVRDDSPALYAGFKTGDEILQVDGKNFLTPEDLRVYIMNKAIDEEVVFTVKRGEVTSTIRVKTDVKRNYDAEFSV